MTFAQRALELLARWAADADQWYAPVPGQPGLACYGTGFNAWGVQTNQKYLAAMATLGALGEAHGLPAGVCKQARDRALATLRYSLWSHRVNGGSCLDGTPWGHTWITPLGVERMMHGVYLLRPWLQPADEAALRAMLVSEAIWQCDEHVRGNLRGVGGNVWNHSGQNAPESNLWVGAILWRAAEMYPDHPRAADWRERAHQFLVNSVSVEADATDDRLLAGKPIRERFVGANFFPDYALDHHGYLNVGYMVICTSNAAMLHFDLRLAGLAAPETLHHHQADLWQTIRRCLFADGRLARLGGDSRLRYTYCQEYLLPSLLYAGDHLGDAHATGLLDRQLSLIETEAAHAGNGSFYGGRLASMRRFNPYYYTRLESDRAAVLGMTAAYLAHATLPPPTPPAAFEASVAGGWCQPEHGAVLHRSPTRLASFSWRAWGLTQGLCQPPDDGHLAEWTQNLAGRLRFLGDPGDTPLSPPHQRELVNHQVRPFDGGFLTWGAVLEGIKLSVPEGWTGSVAVRHLIAIAALPDAHTMLGLQFCQAGAHRAIANEIKGLHLNLPNDLYNRFSRRLAGDGWETVLQAPVPADRQLPLPAAWGCLDDRIGIVGIYGGDRLVVDQARDRRGGRYQSLHVDEICYPCQVGAIPIEAGGTILDCGWAVLSSATPAATGEFARAAEPVASGPLRGLGVTGLDGVRYTLLFNPTAAPVLTPLAAIGLTPAAVDLATGSPLAAAELLLPPTAALLLRD